jgi:YegS/Rv2252/BmrU family lipid kinase
LRILVIFNPRAAAGRSSRLRARIEAALGERGVAFELLSTRGPGDATELAASADLANVDGVVAAGGDGTLFEVLNGLYARPADSRPALGVIPVGTGNAFARDLGLEPGDWRAAVDIVARGRARAVDVGHVSTGAESYHFLNIIGMGFAVDAGLAARRVKFLGNAAYTVGTLWQVLKLGSYPLDIEIDGRRRTMDNVFLEVSNSRYTGTSFLIAPRARLDDGLLDLTLLRPCSRLRLLRLFPTIYSGQHVQFEEVESCRARHVRVHGPADMPLAADGEFRGTTPFEVRCLPGDLQLFC